MCDELLSEERSKLARHSLTGEVLDYSNNSDTGIDHKESARDFIQSIEDFIHRKARELGAARTKMGVPEGMTEQELSNWKFTGSKSQGQFWKFVTDIVSNQC